MTILQAIRTTATCCANNFCAKFGVAACCAAAFTLFLASNTFGQSPLFSGGGAELSGASTVQNGLFLQGKDTYRVVDTAGFRTAADVGGTQPGSIAQVGFSHGCTSCGTASCGGNCGGSVGGCAPCGTGSCGSVGYNSGISDPCAPCKPYCYISVEGLYMDNDVVGGFSLSPHFRVGDFEHEFGSRITVGSVSDCVHGYEVSFVGPIDWDRSGRFVATAPATLSTTLLPGTLPYVANLTSFGDYSNFLDADPTNNFLIPTATEQRQRYEAEYWSLEANKTLVSGEFAKLLIGTRYINYDELYVFDSIAGGGFGQLSSTTDNDLYGLQIGMDLLYPICCHGYTDFRFRAGAFINSADNDFRLFNNATLVQSIQDDTTEIAGMFELGMGIRYQVGEMLSLRVGTELWYLTEVATAQGQFTTVINDQSGRQTNATDDVLMTGVSFGAELRY